MRCQAAHITFAFLYNRAKLDAPTQHDNTSELVSTSHCFHSIASSILFYQVYGT